MVLELVRMGARQMEPRLFRGRILDFCALLLHGV